jgi:hypothetical protein
MAREVFKTHDLVFSGRPALYVAKKLSYECVNLSFAPYGEYWREVRKIVILELLSPKRVQMFQSVRDEEIGLMIDSIAHTSNKGLVNLSEVTVSLANNVLCRCAFGKKYDGEGEIGMSRIHELLKESMVLLGGLYISDFLPWIGWINKFSGLEQRVDKCFKNLDNFYNQVIEEHLDPQRPNPENEDVIDVLLRVQKDPSQSIVLTDEQIKGVITVCSFSF